MKHAFILIAVVMIMLTGCSEIRFAKANDIRATTNRKNDNHNLALADKKALTPVRLAVAEVILWTLMAGGVVVIISAAGAISYSLGGASFYFIRDKRAQQIPLDVNTRQYPLLIYANGRRLFNPNTGERIMLNEVCDADLLRIEASTQVQLAGLLSDSSQIIKGEVIR